MLVPDVNVLVYAHFRESPSHEAARNWVDAVMFGDELVATPDVVLTGFIRIATNPTLFATPPSMAEAFSVALRLHVPPNGIPVHPGPKHWEIFERLVVEGGLTSKDVSDAYLAAFAIENDATFVTFDRGFRRFPGLRLEVLE